MLKHLNNFFSTATMVALIIGLTKAKDHMITLEIILYAIFFVFLRVKIYMDDYIYFKTAPPDLRKSTHFFVGFFLAIISWAFWALSGYLVIENTGLSFLLLGITIVISTIWIVVDGLKKGASKDQYYWIATNVIYVGLLWVKEYFKLLPTTVQVILSSVMLGVLLFDFIRTWNGKTLDWE